MRVLLVQPQEFRSGLYDSLFLFSPLPLETLAATIASHHDVRILDLRLAGEMPQQTARLRQELEEFLPDVVGVTALTLTAVQALDVLRQTKDWNVDTLTMMGGRHATAHPTACQWPFVDFIVLGEADYSFPELIHAIEARGAVGAGVDLPCVPGVLTRTIEGWVSGGVQGGQPDLNALPFPARWLTAPQHDRYRLPSGRGPALFLETSRGCSFRCKFCAVPSFYQGGFRAKTAQRVVDELAQDSREWVLVADDNFLDDVARAEELATTITHSGLQRKFIIQARTDAIARNPKLLDQWTEAGLGAVYLGFEDFDRRRLRALGANKSGNTNGPAVDMVRERGVEAFGGFIVHPNFTHEDFDEMEEYTAQLNATLLVFYVLTPYPGTAIFDEMREDITEWDYRLWDSFHAVLPTRLPLEVFYQRYRRLFRKYWQTADRSGMNGTYPLSNVLEWYRKLAQFPRDAAGLAQNRPAFADVSLDRQPVA